MMLRMMVAIQKSFQTLINQGRLDEILALNGNQDLPDNLSLFTQLGTAMSKEISLIKIMENPNIVSAEVNIGSITDGDKIKYAQLYETFIANMEQSSKSNDTNAIADILIEAVSNSKFTKKEIYEELGVTKQTFKKWLNYSIGNKFDRRKEITLLEYIEIQEKLLLPEEDNKFNFSKNEELYYQISKKLVFSKEEIKEIADSNLKTMKKELARFPIYNEMNIFPLSIKTKFINRLNGEDL